MEADAGLERPAHKLMRQATQWALPTPMKLSLGVLWGYGSAAFGQYAADLYINMFIQIFLLDTARVPAFWTGIITSCAEIVEVIASLVYGVLSDRTRSRYGNRRPWIFWGSIFGSLTLLTLFFNVPDTIFTEDYRIAYYMSAIVLSSMSFPALSIPHQALATEISSDYDQRLNLAASRSSFSFAGMLVMTIYIFVVFTFGVPSGSYQVWLVLSSFPAVATLVFGIVCFLVVPNQSNDEEDYDEVKLHSTATCCGRCCRLITLPPFVLVVAIFGLCGLTQSVTLSLFPLFVVHVLGFGLDTVSQVLIVMIGITVVTTFSLSRLGHRFEKKTILGFGCITGMLTYSFFFWLPGVLNPLPDATWFRYALFVFSGFAGFTNALIFTIPNSMMADVTDVALLRSKAKQEGIMFSSMETLQSIIQAAVGFVVFWRLDQIGYVNAGLQPAIVQQELRLYFCAIPVGVYFIVWILASMYTIDRAYHRQTLRDIKKLKSEDVDVTADVLGSGYKITSLMAGNMWDSKDTIKLHRDRAKVVRNAIASASGDRAGPRSPSLNPKIMEGQSYDSSELEEIGL